MEILAKNMIIDGIFASEGLDTSGEILDVKGCDISDLEEGRGVLNFEHNSNSAEDILGKIIYAKKIYNEKDCDNERELVYWNKIKIPFIYGKAELFDGEGHPGAIASAAIVRYYHRRNEPLLARYSIEGTTLDRDKSGNVLKRSVARKIALTLKPCNRSCYSGVIFDDHSTMGKSEKQIYKGEYQELDIFVADSIKVESDNEYEEISKAFKRSPQKIRLDHYSKEQNLDIIDPKFHGSGKSDKARSRKMNDPKNWVDRSYYYEEGTKPEGWFKGQKKHTVELPEDAKIYDLSDDVDDLASKSKNDGGIGVNLSLLERNIKEAGYTGYKHSGSSLPNAVAIFHPMKTIKSEDLGKTLTLGGYGGAPSSRTQGAALQTEQWAGPVKDPKEKNRRRSQTLAAFRDWDRTTPIRKFLKSKLPEASDTYIERFARIVDEYQVKKAEGLFGELYSTFKTGGAISLFEKLEKSQSQEVSSYKVYVPKTGESTKLNLLGNLLKYEDGSVVSKGSIKDLFKLVDTGEFILYSLKKGKIPGGKADNNKPSDFDQKELKIGIDHELEHTNDREVAKEIAMDHLKEDPKYYTHLEEMESKQDIKKNEKVYVHVEIHGLDEITDVHNSASKSFITMFFKAATAISKKHGGNGNKFDRGKFMSEFDSDEKAKGFIDDIQHLDQSIKSVDHEHKLMLNIGMGNSYGEADENLRDGQDSRGDETLHSFEEIKKAYGDSPEDQKKILNKLFSNHISTGSHLKRIQEEFDKTPESQRGRAQIKLDRAKSSRAHTEHYLNRAIKEYHPDKNSEDVVDGLFDDFLEGSKEIDKKEAKLPGEYKFQNRKDLEHHLSNENFAIMSPFSDKRSQAENDQHHKSFLDDLKLGGHSYTAAKGKFGQTEPSYIIHNISNEDATTLARKYDQFSHIQSEAGNHSYMSHKKHGYSPPGNQGHEISDDFDDLYTEVNFASGGKTKFKVNLE